MVNNKQYETFELVNKETGEVLSSTKVEVKEGKAATAPSAPIVEGYKFAGWDKTFDNVTSDLIVTAKYEKVGGCGNSASILFTSLMLLGFVILAIIGNILVYKLHLGTENCQPGDNLSMFYISPYYPTQLPLLGAVQSFSYPLFVLCYLILFNSFSLIVFYSSKLMRKISLKLSKK